MEDPELTKLFSVTSFPKIMLWSKRCHLPNLLVFRFISNVLIQDWVLTLIKEVSPSKYTYKYNFKLICTAPRRKWRLNIKRMSKVGGRGGHLHVHPAPHLRQANGPHIQVIQALSAASIRKSNLPAVIWLNHPFTETRPRPAFGWLDLGELWGGQGSHE